MARDLKSLVGAGSARQLQEKLESWHQDYELNSSGENLSRCCELLELNTAIQKQLFSILNETSQEDECPVKSCLLPKVCCSAPRCPSLSQESFRAAKKAFWKIKITVKRTLAADYCGRPAALDVAVLNYIACHKDLFDFCCCVQEVVCCLNVNPKLPCPSDVDFNVINCFIRELCCLAFLMQTLIPALDIAFGIDGELFNRNMYYRSCDSDFTAPFVAYHIWPALMENGVVIVKGEVVTRKMVQCYRRSKIRSRSCGCGRRLLPGQVTRSRSLSTVRFKTSRH